MTCKMLLQRKLEEENADTAIVLHCITQWSRSLQHRQFRAFLEEIEVSYGDVLYFIEVL